MFRVVLSFLLCAAASAFFLSTSRVSVRPSSSALFGDLFPNGGCPEKLMDGNGRCPGQSGFTPQPFKVEAQYKDFKAFSEFQKKKKAEEAAAKAAAEKK